MKYIDFKEIIKTYSKNVKKNQVSKKKSKLELALIIIIIASFIGVICCLLIGENNIAAIID